MKIQMQVENLQEYYTTRASIMNSIPGDPNGHMIGIRGERCCRIIWEQGSEEYRPSGYRTPNIEYRRRMKNCECPTILNPENLFENIQYSIPNFQSSSVSDPIPMRIEY